MGLYPATLTTTVLLRRVAPFHRIWVKYGRIGAVDDPDWESDVSAEDGRMSASDLAADEASTEGVLWVELQPFLDCHDVLGMHTPANKWNDARKHEPVQRALLFSI